MTNEGLTDVKPPLAVAALITAVSSVSAQVPAFEVISIQMTPPGTRIIAMPHVEAGGRFVTANVPVGLLMNTALGVHRRDRLVGAPAWVSTARFNVEAKAPADVAANPAALASQVKDMVKTLLADRFQLRFHIEDRNAPVYALVKDRAGSVLGPSLKRSTYTCQDWLNPATPPSAVPCDFHLRTRDSISGYGKTMRELAEFLGDGVDRQVVDKTGIDGRFDLSLTWDDAAGPSMFTAIQEQLGLRLESTTAPVQFVVIDHIERPTEN
jgi:uncharacterized protein (TIGR03435 family)